MKQPDFGLKVIELRQQKGLTQDNWLRNVKSVPERSNGLKMAKLIRVLLPEITSVIYWNLILVRIILKTSRSG